ncbi:MAG TPA: biotin transporter BioY [Actinobacteria bacterium]|nr:biotin transporter BioY [Actinomycetota bacterium]
MTTRDLSLTAMFAALTAIGAWITIPIQPVPFTFQVLIVLLAGALLGSLKGGLSQIVYVLLGVVGLPVFAGGASGPGVLVGPSGGYIIGFVVAAFVIGAICEVVRSFWGTLGAMVIGMVIIYAFGVVQLMIVLNLNFPEALSLGVFPFVPFDLIKALIAVSLVGRLRPILSLNPSIPSAKEA